MARAQIIVRDFTDGINAPAISLQNDNHTFTADADGSIMTTAGWDDSNHVNVRIGNTVYAYGGTGANPAANQFTISNITYSSGAGFSVAFAASTVDNVAGARGTIADGAGTTGFFDSGDATSQANAEVTLTIRINGFTSPFTRTFSFSKARGGDAPIVRLYTNTQVVPVDFGTNTPKVGGAIITMTAVSTNIDSGAFTWGYRAVGTTGSYIPLTDSLTGVTVGGTDSNTLTMTHTAFAGFATSSANGIEVRATRMAVFDSETVDKNIDAAPATGLQVRIVSGPAEYRNNLVGTDTVLEASVQVAGITQEGASFTTGLAGSYQWIKNGVNLTTGTLTRTQQSGEGPQNYRIRINSTDISDGGQDVIECTISDATLLSTYSA